MASATVHPAQFRRNSSGYNAAYGRSDCLSENDRARAPPCGFQFTRLVLRPATHLDPARILPYFERDYRLSQPWPL